MASDWYSIKVVNWDKYNPRSDRGGFSWFRLDNQFFLHMRQRKGLSADATVLMSFLLAEASSQNGAEFKLRPKFASEIIGRKINEIENALRELETSGEITIKRLEAASTLTDGRTDETDGRDETGQEVDGALRASSPGGLPRLAVIWNGLRGNLPEVRGVSGTRRKHAEARWREKPDANYWAEVIDRIQKSPFCTGSNDRGWRADFDFLIRPETRHKVLEGKYDARTGPAAADHIDWSRLS